MTEEEKMKFWGELVEPIVALLGGLTVRGEFKLVEVVQVVVAKAENAALEEREACAKECESLNLYGNTSQRDLESATIKDCARAIRARGRYD